MNFFNFFCFWKYRYRKKNWGYNRATVNSVTQKILVSDMESCEKNIPKICNIRALLKIFKNVKKRLKKLLWVLKILINSFEIKRRIFRYLLITRWHYYYAKSVFDIYNIVDVSQILIISRSVKILIILNFWLRVYTSLKGNSSRDIKIRGRNDNSLYY